MKKHLATLAAVASLSGFAWLPLPATAMPVGAALSIQRGVAETTLTKPVVRICHNNVRTGQRRCWVDRSRPPTVCHVVRERDGTRRLDCY